ncbi:organic solute transporter subunit alpha-like [Patiria miniata]|uniref:Uncharacterized protein n=1 Tax=Patiria miniata TaxID=46514 RepID=A0A914BCD5_PATMI|nr:organic solute transporter subunit alpha-like [Patiria miniata]
MSFLGIQPVFCNFTTAATEPGYVTQLSMEPIYSLIFLYASIVSVVTLVLFLEACHFVATRVPRSAVANQRLNTVIIMSIFPVFILVCLPSLLVPTAAAFCLALADLYYSFTMFKFIVLQVGYYGGHRKMMVKLTTQEVTFRINVPVLCCFFCFKPFRLTRRRFFWLKIGVLQIAILKPLLTFTQAIMGFAQLVSVGDLIHRALTIVTTLVAVTSLNMMTENSASKEIKEKYCLEAKSQIMSVALIILSLQKSIIGIAVLFRPLGCLVPIPTYLLGNQWQSLILLLESTFMMIPVLRFFRTADGNVVGVPPPLEHPEEEEEPHSQIGKMRQWVRRHTLM